MMIWSLSAPPILYSGTSYTSRDVFSVRILQLLRRSRKISNLEFEVRSVHGIVDDVFKLFLILPTTWEFLWEGTTEVKVEI